MIDRITVLTAHTPNWAPLQRELGTAIDEWMWMYTYRVNASGQVFEAYKHSIDRHYLYLPR